MPQNNTYDINLCVAHISVSLKSKWEKWTQIGNRKDEARLVKRWGTKRMTGQGIKPTDRSMAF